MFRRTLASTITPIIRSSSSSNVSKLTPSSTSKLSNKRWNSNIPITTEQSRQYLPTPSPPAAVSVPSTAGTPTGVLSPVAKDLRQLFRHSASAVWIVTAAVDGKPVGFTAISLVSVSMEPPMVSFNINRTSSSLPTITRSMTFAAHLLSQEQTDVAARFAAKPTERRFADPNTYTWDDKGLPFIPNSLGRITGTIQSLSAAGDSLLAIALITTSQLSPGLPLVYHAGAFLGNLPLNHVPAVVAPKTRPGPRQMHLNAFDMTCVGHQSPGLWAHPEDEAWRYKDITYWTELAQLLDKGGFDSLFIADVLGTYDVYQGSRDAAVRQATQVPVNDPAMSISAMAAVTKRLGFGVTVSLTYEKPYSFARKMSTLDHLTNGRVAWNIVTSYLQSAAVNLGLDTQISHDTRYDIAEEFMDVVYKLWEQSWQEDAVVRDRVKRIFTHPEKIHDINHKGKYYQVPGVHLCEPSLQRTPVLFQAGASARGQQFAAKHSEGMFVIGVTPEALRKTVDDIRKKAKEQGRNPRSVKIFAALTIVTDVDDAKAQAKYQDYKKYASVEGALALYGGWTGVDLSKIDVDAPLKHVENDSLRTVGEMFTRADPSKVWTPRLVAEFLGVGGMGPVVVGGPTKIADEMERWMEVADVDGFNLCYAITPGTFRDIVQHVVPVLRQRGRIPSEESIQQEETQKGRHLTLREKIGFSTYAGPRVADDHPGAVYRKNLQQITATTNAKFNQKTA